MLIYIFILTYFISSSFAPNNKCRTGEFLCQNGNCIQKSSLCDGINTCGDNSDEILCPKSCNSQQFNCKNDKKCIPIDKKCDGKFDCKDKSDELDCDKPCDSDEFTCKNGRCIALQLKCDRDDDCGDRSDELNCSYPQYNCSKNEFMCTNTFCIPQRWRCDGDIDCTDNSDEMNCEQINPRSGFRLTKYAPSRSPATNSKPASPSGIIVSSSSSSIDDDASNWRNRNILLRPFLNANAYRCNQHEFKCNNGHCIMASWRCDGDTDCLDGSDEINCTQINCHTYEFKCRNNKCIMGVFECNGVDDCGDNSDEVNCANKGKICDLKKEFDCGDSCIPLSKVCDGKNDCGEGQDESKLCGVNECLKGNSGGCQHICRDEKIGFSCDCKPGYSLSLADKSTCLDVNECALTPGTCSQICVNTVGGFRCECHANYTLVPGTQNTTTFCKAEGGHAKLLFANRRDIRMIDAIPLSKHSKYRLLVSELHSSVAIDFDHQTQRIYWSDVSSEKIYSTPLIEGKDSEGYNADSVETVVEGDINMPDGISIDWIYRLIYWTDTGKNTIEVARLPPTTAYSTQANATSLKPIARPGNSTTYGGGTVLARMVLIDKDLDEPRAIISDPRHRYIYWTDWGSKPRIEKCGANGIGRRAIVTKNIVWPNGLAIDFANDRLYWADAKLDQIVSSDLEGQNRLIVIDSKKKIRHPFAITVFEDWMYWTDWENETLFSANKFTGEDMKPLAKDLYSPMDVRVYHPLKQPMFNPDGTKVINVCGTYKYNGGCEHLCLPGPEHKMAEQVDKGQSALYICACSTGYQIDKRNPTRCVFQNVSIIIPDSAPKKSGAKAGVDDSLPFNPYSNGKIYDGGRIIEWHDDSFTKIFDNDDIMTPKPNIKFPANADVFSKYDNYKSHHDDVVKSVSRNTADAQKLQQASGSQKNHKSRLVGSFTGVFITLVISCLIIFLLWKNYSTRTVKTMNFDNPVYRKTTEDHINLDDNRGIFSSTTTAAAAVSALNNGINNGFGLGNGGRLGAAFNSKLRFSPLNNSYGDGVTSKAPTPHHQTPNGFGHSSNSNHHSNNLIPRNIYASMNKTFSESPLHRLGLKSVIANGIPAGVVGPVAGYTKLHNTADTNSSSCCALEQEDYHQQNNHTSSSKTTVPPPASEYETLSDARANDDSNQTSINSMRKQSSKADENDDGTPFFPANK